MSRLRAALDRLRADPGLAMLLVALVAVAALYAPAIGRGLVNYDDNWLVRDNYVVKHLSWDSLHTIFFDLDSPKRFALAPEYLPIRDLSMMLDYAVWGDWYGGFHLTTLVLYLASIALWWKALIAFGIDRKVAGIAMLLWALHPSHAESVAWASERKGVLGMMFAGACALAYAKYRGGASARWLALAMPCAVCAVWSKALAAFALATLGGLELVLPGRVSWRRSLVGLAAIGGVALLAYIPVVKLAASAAVVGSEVKVPSSRIATVLGVHGFYVELGAMVIRNAISYPLSTVGPSTLDIVLGTVGLAAVIAVAAGPRRWISPPLRAAAVIWLVGWLPVSHLVLPLQMVFVADRYLFLPTLGLALAVAIGCSAIASARARRALLAVLAVSAAIRAFDAQSNWRDPRTLWQRATVSNPDDGNAWSFYAEALTEQGKYPEAAQVVAEGLRHSQAPRLLYREAYLVLGFGDRGRALEIMRRAAEGGEPHAMQGLALMLLDDGMIQDAYSWGKRCAKVAPTYINGLRAYGKAALAAHHPDEALAAYRSAADYEPGNPVNDLDLARALIDLHRTDEARHHLEACAHDPREGEHCRAELARLP